MKNNVISFLHTRRSVVAKKMLPVAPSQSDLDAIIDCGLRVPDHANVQPWQLVILQGESRKQFDEQTVLKAAIADASEPLTDMQQQLECSRMQRSGVVIAVLSTPVSPHKIPVWEQQASAAAVCTHLLLAAQSLDYAAQWITEWLANHKSIIAALGGDPATDRVAGFIHIGKKEEEPKERNRPERENKVMYWQS